MHNTDDKKKAQQRLAGKFTKQQKKKWMKGKMPK